MDDSFSIVLKKMFGFAQNQVTGERKRWKKRGIARWPEIN